MIRFALSRQREYLADAGSVGAHENPDAMISALRKIEGRGELAGANSAVMEMCIDNPRAGLCRPVCHAPIGRYAGRGAGQVCRRSRPWAARRWNAPSATASFRPPSKRRRAPGPSATQHATAAGKPVPGPERAAGRCPEADRAGPWGRTVR